MFLGHDERTTLKERPGRQDCPSCFGTGRTSGCGAAASATEGPSSAALTKCRVD